MRLGMMKIFTALAHEGVALTFTELKQVTELSNPVLSEYLSLMQEQGVIKRNPKTRKYSLAKIYYPLEAFQTDYQKSLTLFLTAVPNQALTILEIDDIEQRKRVFHTFLEGSFSFFMLAFWKIIGESIAVLSKKEDLANQNSVQAINSTVNNAIRDWIAPMANSLAVSIGLNVEVVDDVGKEFFEKILQETSQKMLLLKNSLDKTKPKH